jgi:hypothetical protein
VKRAFRRGTVWGNLINYSTLQLCIAWGVAKDIDIRIVHGQRDGGQKIPTLHMILLLEKTLGVYIATPRWSLDENSMIQLSLLRAIAKEGKLGSGASPTKKKGNRKRD